MRIGLTIVGLCMSTSVSAAQPWLRYAAPLKYVQCNFDKTRMVIGFTEKPSKVIDAQSPDVPMLDAKVTAQEISFRSDNPFHSYSFYAAWHPDSEVKEAPEMAVKINRVSGQITLTFLKEYGAKERDQCRALNPTSGWFCNDRPVAAMKYGTCIKVAPRF